MFFIVITASVAETPSLSVFLSEKGIPGGLYLTGEVMFILRPLVYVLLIRKYGARSWFPWITSLVVDLLGNGIISFVSIARKNSNNFRLTNVEKNEVRHPHVSQFAFMITGHYLLLKWLSIYTHTAVKKAKAAVGALPNERSILH